MTTDQAAARAAERENMTNDLANLLRRAEAALWALDYTPLRKEFRDELREEIREALANKDRMEIRRA